MWETINNNVLIKTIVVSILGVLGFGLAFNIMFGGNTGMMGQEMNGGYALDSTLAYILMIMVKLLLIAIVVTALIAIYKLGRKYLFEGGENKLFETVKKDPVIKAVSVIIAAVLTIALIDMLLGNNSGGFGAAPNYYYYMGVSSGLSLVTVLTFLAKLLLTISVVGLAVSVIFYIAQKPTNPHIEKILNRASETTPGCNCGRCGMALKPEWKCCPVCGEEMESAGEKQAEKTENVEDAENNGTKENIDSNEVTDVYEKLYDSTTEEKLDDTKHTITKKKQNKR